jgi:hypothetical protein
MFVMFFYTTKQVIQITTLNKRTFEAWVRKGWVPPSAKGGGRGNPNAFDQVSTAWAITLSEIFRIWPKSSTPVYLLLWEPRESGLEPRWSEPMPLSNGHAITQYLGFPQPVPDPVTVLLTTGYKTPQILRPSDQRFAEIRIGPFGRAIKFVQNWFGGHGPVTYIPEAPSNELLSIVRCAAFINFSQVSQHVVSMAKGV